MFNHIKTNVRDVLNKAVGTDKMEDSKLMKFKILIDEIDNTLPGHMTRIDPMFAERRKMEYPLFEVRMKDPDHYDPSIIGKHTTNPFTEILYKKFNPYERGWESRNVFDNPLRMIEYYLSDVRKEVKYCLDNAFSDIYGELAQNGRLIFWLLFSAAIDDEIYNNELSAIIDMAYCMDFSEGMIRDWCHAVEYVLNGNKLSKDCDLKCETENGKAFFIEGCRND